MFTINKERNQLESRMIDAEDALQRARKDNESLKKKL